MATTLRDVAARLSLSPGLVSRVLNNDAEVWVSVETRQRIHTAAREMQYRPSPSARSLSTRRSRQIAVSGADAGLHGYLSSRLLEQQGLIEAASQKGYQIVVLPSTANQTDSRDFEDVLYTSGCDGVCLYAEQATPVLYATLRQLAVPFVVLGNPADATLPQVDHDNYHYAYDGVAWLHQQGHTRIGFTDFLAPHLQPFAALLHQGYRDAMRDLCGGFDPALVTPQVLTPQERVAFLTRPHTPTALIVREWIGANAWRLVLQQHGIRVPEDIVVLVHISVAESHYLEPGFAFQAHDPRAIGLRAGQMLVESIESGIAEPSQSVLVPTLAPQWRTDWNSVMDTPRS